MNRRIYLQHPQVEGPAQEAKQIVGRSQTQTGEEIADRQTAYLFNGIAEIPISDQRHEHDQGESGRQ